MEPTAPTRASELEAVRRRRAELRESINALEQALASPALGRPLIWGERVRTVLVEVADDFREHITVTEGPDGLHQAIVSADLRLANAVDALTAEHQQIRAEIDGLVVASEPPVTADEAAEIRERATRMLGHVIRHRQRGADLIFDAYQTDIGGGD